MVSVPTKLTRSRRRLGASDTASPTGSSGVIRAPTRDTRTASLHARHSVIRGARRDRLHPGPETFTTPGTTAVAAGNAGWFSPPHRLRAGRKDQRLGGRNREQLHPRRNTAEMVSDRDGHRDSALGPRALRDRFRRGSRGDRDPLNSTSIPGTPPPPAACASGFRSTNARDARQPGAELRPAHRPQRHRDDRQQLARLVRVRAQARS